ncbi:MAG: UPF0182 family protein [Gemmatimonas sp.]
MRRSRWIISIVAGIAVLLLGGRAFTALFVNKAWFAALGGEPVFWEQVQDIALWRGGLFLAGALFAFLNLHAVRRTILAVAVPTSVANIAFTEMLPARRLLAFTVVAAAVVGLLLTVPFDDWTVLAMARHGIRFGEMEFYFQRDLGHYVYWLPLEQALYVWSLLSIVVMVALVIVLYALMRSLRLEGRRIVVTTYARRHLTVLGSLMMALLAWSYRLDGYDLLRYGSGLEGQFLYIDRIVAVQLDFGLSILTLFGSMLLLSAGWAGRARMATFTLTLILVGAIGIRHGVPIVLERSSKLGDPARREIDFILTRALVSRRAYDVEGMTVINSDTSAKKATGVQLRDLPRVLSVWDAPSLARTLNGGSVPRVNIGSVAWSPHDNALDGLLLQRPVDGDGPWTMVTVPGASADDRGAPMSEVLALGDALDSASISIADNVGAGIVGAPLIAPDATGHVLVVDTTTRIVGARLATEGRRIAHAWATRDPRLLSHDESGLVPTLVMWRDVRERIRKLAPIFAQGRDVVPVMYEGALYWTVELYSASDMYPLSQRWILAGDVRSYFRHAATAMIHSRTGRVRLITVAKPDPIARTWMALAPDLFVAPEKLAPALLAQLPPPTDGTIAQARAFARFGSNLDGPIIRQLPDSIIAGDNLPGILFDGRFPAAGWSTPILNGPQQIAGIALSVGGAQRGSRWMPVNKLDTRWGVITDQLRAALDTSRQQLAEPGRREPQTAFGRVRAVLVNGAPAVMQPMYVTRLNQAQSLARVAVAYEGKVAVGASTFDAVRQLESPGSGAPNNGAGTSNVPFSAAAKQTTVNRLYDAMRAAMRRGDWTRFGTAFDSLGVMLGRPPQ